MNAIDPAIKSVLWLLLFIWALALVVAFVLGKPSADRTRRSIPWLQRSTSLLLAVMAVLFWAGGGRATPLSAFSLLVALGMSVSFVADLIMAEMIRVPNRVLGGIVVFGIAHALYMTAYLSAGRALDLAAPEIRLNALGGLFVFGLLVWVLLVRSPDASPVLNYGSLAYTLLICGMAGLALSLALQALAFWILAAGALLFLVSDIILGNHIFRRNNWPLVGEVVWWTYIVGQALIVWSAAVVLG